MNSYPCSSSVYTHAFRSQVVAAYENGEGSLKVISQRFGIGKNTLQRWLSNQRQSGDISGRQPGRPSRMSAEHLSLLRQI